MTTSTFIATVLTEISAKRNDALLSSAHQGFPSIRHVEKNPCGMFVYFDENAHNNFDGIANCEIGFYGELPACLKNGFGVELFIRNGKFFMLEFFTYDENWPEEFPDEISDLKIVLY